MGGWVGACAEEGTRRRREGEGGTARPPRPLRLGPSDEARPWGAAAQGRACARALYGWVDGVDGCGGVGVVKKNKKEARGQTQEVECVRLHATRTDRLARARGRAKDNLPSHPGVKEALGVARRGKRGDGKDPVWRGVPTPNNARSPCSSSTDSLPIPPTQPRPLAASPRNLTMVGLQGQGTPMIEIVFSLRVLVLLGFVCECGQPHPPLPALGLPHGALCLHLCPRAAHSFPLHHPQHTHSTIIRRTRTLTQP